MGSTIIEGDDDDNESDEAVEEEKETLAEVKESSAASSWIGKRRASTGGMMKRGLSEHKLQMKIKRENTFMATTWAAQRKHIIVGLGWRSEPSRKLRLILAWAFNFGLFLFCCFIAVIYGLKFKEEATKAMCMSWLIAYGVTFAIIEPVQVLMITCAPWCVDEESRTGRNIQRCRFVYNEICSP